MREAQALGLKDNITFTGFHADVAALYPLLDVFVMASVTEGTPMVLLEAMAMHIPIVATAVGGIKDILQDGSNGILVQPRDPQGLAQGILRVLNDRDYAAELVANAALMAQSRSTEAMAREYEKLYRSLAAQAASLSSS